ncbi:MAG: hypothetical protein LBP90_01525 [Burkholderiales bacterium]|jgi:S-formylglutathione hydrolase FrmB|nr:hypothetical protein [Burkholderiales bacterium]
MSFIDRRTDGTLITVEHTSSILDDNLLGDPATRRFPVWLPPQYDQGMSRGKPRRFPVLYSLAGFFSSGSAHTNWHPFEENIADRVARLVRNRKMGPVIVVFPDCFTALGGNQYINSSAIGRYADYLTREIIPFIDREFHTLSAREHRGCFGKSSGGYGALIHAMKYPRDWGAVASHAGDAYFELCYLPGWPTTLTELSRYRRPLRRAGRETPPAPLPEAARGIDDGRVKRFLAAMRALPRLNFDEGHALMNIAMAASYDPDPRAPNGFRLPFDLDTGELLPERWRCWQRHDPVRLVGRYRDALRSLRGLYLDCGWRDQYHMHYGTRILARELTAHGIRHRYEAFDGTHSGIDHRLDISLPWLYKALKP